MDRILENFRAFLKEKEVRELEVGDRVYFNPGKIAVGRDGVTEPDEYYTITGKRRMFASDLHAYTVDGVGLVKIGEEILGPVPELLGFGLLILGFIIT